MDRLSFDPLPPLPFACRLPAAAYHADPCPVPSLSASVAAELVRASPYHAWLKHPRLGALPRESTREQERGTLIHALVFYQRHNTQPIDHADYRTKAAKRARDDAIKAGKTPMLRREFIDAELVAVGIQIELDRLGVRLDGDSEVVHVWEEPTEHGPVLCRGMMDHVTAHRGVILDLKTIRSAHPRECAKSMVAWGYDVQWAAYTSAFRSLHPEYAGREEMLFLFAEELPPDSPKRVILTVAHPSGTMRELGVRKWAYACETWARCLKTNDWPAYGDAATLEAPAWALAEELGR